ncbi:E3 ubiquitin-protein ligase HUWE1 isoform X3 [Coccinella septempunctata]|uniref:E3 ubiquitin-protein ligase HUWE1 isoform X3 n=1 Tax=Coccinella septempunctata TaxID=41139 RepID=UPI001D06FEC6|nr:E3 ubiquitin-protein ligase HUWE1 isoform X3 [Coccinella septempunctata]
MKVDRARLKKFSSEVPAECFQIIEHLQTCTRPELLDELSKIHTWTFGKCELYHWAPVLDIFDRILEEACEPEEENKWMLFCDIHYSPEDRNLLLWILHFSTLLIEHSFSRHLYNSMGHLLALLQANDMSIVLGVLNLLYMFSKRSNFITRLKTEEKVFLTLRLYNLAENWGGKENGFGLAECCDEDKPIAPSATTLHVEFHKDDIEIKDPKDTRYSTNIIHIEHVDKLHKTPAEIMKSLVSMYNIPEDKEMWLYCHVRLAHQFSEYKSRLLLVQARLQALSILIYSNALQDSPQNLLYPGILEELVELIELPKPHLVEIRSAALRTLTAIIHLDRSPHIAKKPGSRLHNIIDVTGASQYHGFLPVMVRTCISILTNQNDERILTQAEGIFPRADIDEASEPVDFHTDGILSIAMLHNNKSKFPLALATALFSFLYHLASYEAGGEALVTCGMMESLLQVINWHGTELEHITFVTRAVRVIDLITNIDMQAFQTHEGLQSFINRLSAEVNLCRKDQLVEVKTRVQDDDVEEGSEMDTGESVVQMITHPKNQGKTCLPQRAALLKSMLNFLKKAFQDTTFYDNVRHLMEGPLPDALKNIIANAEYYGPSLFLLATDVVTVYVYQEPALLSTIQDNGLTDVVLYALLTKEVPPTREVLGSLPNIFSALCLNHRGLTQFTKFKPFETFFKILISPTYLAAMRRRRSSEPMSDTACNLGNAMDELMRHQPSLKADAIAALVNLLQELVNLGTDPKYICWRPSSKTEISPSINCRVINNTEGSSDEDDDEEEETSTSSQNAEAHTQNSERQPIALIDYILNVMKFVDAILSNNSTDDHCKEFIQQGGLPYLLRLLRLPNLPVDYPATNTAQAVATVCKSILNLAHDCSLFKEGLHQLAEVLLLMKPLFSKTEVPGGSKLLMELASAPNTDNAFSTATDTPLLHGMSAAHGFVIMFVNICRTGQNDIRSLSLQQWGTQDGIRVLRGLSELYTSLVWESTLLLAYCSEDLMPSYCNIPREDMEKLQNFFAMCEMANPVGPSTSTIDALTKNNGSTTVDSGSETGTGKSNPNVKLIKPLLGSSSRLGRALAELFGILVKLCVGSPVRQRRGQNVVASPPSPSPFARNVATALGLLLCDGLDWEKLLQCPTPKCRLTFLICSVGFTSPMLFDEKRYPYHLLLKKFVECGGLDAFFKTFRWALSAGGTIPIEQGLEDPNLPEGTGGFLDAWLMLLEKMVNPKAVLESPHVVSNRGTEHPVNGWHFDPLKYLITIHKLAFESCQLLWGRKPLPTYGTRMTESMLTIFKHILRGEKIIKEKLKDGTLSALTSSSLTDKDFPDNLKQLMDMGFSREHALEALVHTINLEQATDYLLTHPPKQSQASTSQVEEIDSVVENLSTALGLNNTDAFRRKVNIDNCGSPLAESLIDQFSKDCIKVCLFIIKHIPDCVHKVCELLVAVMKRNGKPYRDQLYELIIDEIYRIAVKIATLNLEDIISVDSNTTNQLSKLCHLYILFLEMSTYFEMRISCAGAAFKKRDLLPALINLVSRTEISMTSHNVGVGFKWLSPVILMIDELSKISILCDRKDMMHSNTSRVWRWFDLVTGKWTPYSSSNNKTINDAYWAGEHSVKVSCGRRRYTVTFANMLQINEESGNNRPIAMTIVYLNHPSFMDITKPPPPETRGIKPGEKEGRNARFEEMDKAQKICMLLACVKLLQLPVDKEVIHSVLQTCVRLTRTFEMAKIFVEEGGVKALLAMKYMNDFTGFGILATILIKHCLEEPNILAYAMEKIIRGRTISTIPPPYKELIYFTRQVGGAITRDPTTFSDVCRTILRLNTATYRNDEIDSRLVVKCEPPVRSKPPVLESRVANEVLSDLLNALRNPLEVDTSPPPPPPPHCSKVSIATQTSEDNINVNEDSSSSSSPSVQTDSNAETKTDSNRLKPMLSKYVILKILADAVVSYHPVAKLVSEYHYSDNTSVLAFLFDKILPETPNLSDSESSSMCRMLIASLASSNHSPEAQQTLVLEVKAALARALSSPESAEKHGQIQSLCGIISTMIENCPPQSKVRPQINNIVRLLIRKGLFNDLARVPLYMDLSSPHLAYTGNACLKPLESLSRIVNQPVPFHMQSKKKTQPMEEGQGFQLDNTSNEDTIAQGEEAIDDTENTEHDISSTLDTTNAEETAEEDNVLEQIMGQLLDPGNTNNTSSNRNHSLEIDNHGNINFETERDATEEMMSTDSGDSDSNTSDQGGDDDNEDNEVDEEIIDDSENNFANSYNDESIEERRRGSHGEGNEDDILMIHYHNVAEDVLPRVRWNENGFTVPIFDEANSNTEHSGSLIHPLLLGRGTELNQQSMFTRTQRTNRARRYQYLFNPRNPNPPVILQRLLGPHDPHIALGSADLRQEIRESPRVIMMDNFGFLPTHEEQIDLVDNSGYLFGSTLAATLSHIPPVLYWWNIEARILDMESVYDTSLYICNQLLPTLIKHRNAEILDKKKNDEQTTQSRKLKLTIHNVDSEQSSEDARENISESRPARRTGNDEELDGVPLEEDDESTNSNITTAQFIRNIVSEFSNAANVALRNSIAPNPFNPESEPPAVSSGSARTTPPNTASSNSGSATRDSSTDPENEQEGESPFSQIDSNIRHMYFETSSHPPSTREIVATLMMNPTQSTQTGQNTPPEVRETSSAVLSEPGPSSLNNEEVPEGVDPSFLAAIPPEMRREVLEQHRLLNFQQRLARASQSQPTSSEPNAELPVEVNSEFLAALPPSLQEEVLNQQRLEQQRQAASNANPNEPVDAGAFFETLQPSLRQMILSDMEDSQISALPPDLAAEAQNLRRDLEARNRQLVQERFLHNNLTTIIRHSARGRISGRPFLPPQRSQWATWGRDILNMNSSGQSGSNTNMKIRGRQLLDHEGLSCLLVLLFTDDSQLNKLRLHRVIRNLCFHGPTREWIVSALLSVVDRSVHTKQDDSLNKPSRKGPKPGPLTSKLMTDVKSLQSGGNWLNIRMEAALGCSANVFIVTRGPAKRSDKYAVANISIHPQAAPIICKNALELIISLSKTFPNNLLPVKCFKEDDKILLSPVKVKTEGLDFWDVLLRLDCASTKKGKSIPKSNTISLMDSDNATFDHSIFGQLLNMLSSPVIYKSTHLTDNLLRLLSVITSTMPEVSKNQNGAKVKVKLPKESFATPVQSINLAVNVITYKSCSEEGLEYITNLLLNLASSSLEMSYLILNLLLTAASKMGDIVKDQIDHMLSELKNLNCSQKRKTDETIQPSTSKGTIANRFTKETVVITASTKVKTSYDLQLPSMVPLTSKSSSQVFFLRVLRVIVNIRHSIKQTLRNEGASSSSQELPPLCEQLSKLEPLWETLSQCLLELEHTPDHHAVLVLQPAVEAFFLVHSPHHHKLVTRDNQGERERDRDNVTRPAPQPADVDTGGGSSGSSNKPESFLVEGDSNSSDSSTKPTVPPEQLKFLNFAEKHRTVLNQILRQSSANLADGPFAVLVDHTRILDFDIKRRYFRAELERMDAGVRREETAVHVRRSNIFEDSFRELYRKTPEEWKNRFYIVFEEEEGQDAGGLLREWYVVISRDIFNPMYALFTVSPGDRVTYMINSASHYNPNHLCYYKFVGRVIAKAIFDNKLLECYFTRSFYKHILGIPVKYTDMESEDYSFYNSLVYLMENNISSLGLDLTFSTEINEFGVTEVRDLIQNGRNVPVTEENKMEYIRLSCQMKMTGAIKQQLNAFLEGFYDIIPMRLISIFNEQELELLISGLPNVDIEDLKANTEYHKYQSNSLQIQWFWRALRSFDQADRAKFLQFVTGTSKVPLQGFGALEGMNGVQKFQIHRDDRSTDRLPSAHTCFNQLDLPVYESYDKLRSNLLKAIHECSEGFGFA